MEKELAEGRPIDFCVMHKGAHYKNRPNWAGLAHMKLTVAAIDEDE